MNKQSGFSAFELMFVLAIVSTVITGVVSLFVVFHFVSKFW